MVNRISVDRAVLGEHHFLKRRNPVHKARDVVNDLLILAQGAIVAGTLQKFGVIVGHAGIVPPRARASRKA